LSEDKWSDGSPKRPRSVSAADWKNRHLVSAKLTPTNWTAVRALFVEKNFNFNSGINYLIATHPETKTHLDFDD